MIFNGRNLNAAVLISASLHIGAIFFVSPVFNAGRIIYNAGDISFLGSIIKRVGVVPEKTFNLDKASFMQKIEFAGDVFSDKVDLTSPEIVSKPAGLQSDKEKFSFNNDRHENTASDILDDKRTKSKINFNASLISGKAEKRAILYRPELDKFFSLNQGFNSDYNVTIKFKVSRHGFVEKPECVVSSGSYEIDRTAINYIRRWQFVPDYESSKDFQEGEVRISF